MNRRNFLKGLGVTLTLPYFESLGNIITQPKQRVAFVYVPNGINMVDWKPKGEGLELPYILNPLESIKNKINIISNLEHKMANPNGDGAGDHARASATFLTGMQARKTSGSDIRIGKSVDQIFAEKYSKQTKLSSLQLSCDTIRNSGNCDSGYSCAYQFNLSWANENTPLNPEVNPRIVFERMFGSKNTTKDDVLAKQYRLKNNMSILDFVKEDANSLKKQLGYSDKNKLDQYLNAIKETEEKLQKEEKFVVNNIENKFTESRDFSTNLEMMYELMFLAFQNDITRVISFIVSHDGSNRTYTDIGIREGHHEISHHQNNLDKKKMLSEINHYHIKFLSKFLEKLNSVSEGENTLLDNSSIVYGAGISDGNRHNHNDLPILVCGSGGKMYQTGRHIVTNGIPMCNMYLGMLNNHNIQIDSFGDSTGKFII